MNIGSVRVFKLRLTRKSVSKTFQINWFVRLFTTITTPFAPATPTISPVRSKPGRKETSSMDREGWKGCKSIGRECVPFSWDERSGRFQMWRRVLLAARREIMRWLDDSETMFVLDVEFD